MKITLNLPSHTYTTTHKHANTFIEMNPWTDKANISTPFSPSSNLQTDLAKSIHENNFESTLAYIHNHTYIRT